MTDLVFTQKHVSREVFNGTVKRIQDLQFEEDKKRYPTLEKKTSVLRHITIYYNGTDLYGDLRIEGRGGYQKEYNDALRCFMEEYTKGSN